MGTHVTDEKPSTSVASGLITSALQAPVPNRYAYPALCLAFAAAVGWFSVSAAAFVA